MIARQEGGEAHQDEEEDRKETSNDGEEGHMYKPASQKEKEGTYTQQLDKDKRDTSAPAGKKKRGTCASTGQGQEEHIYTSRTRRRGAHVHQQAKEKRGKDTPAGQEKRTRKNKMIVFIVLKHMFPFFFPAFTT
jgi:hypothetical protein